MSGESTSRKTESAGLENIREASDAVEKSTAGIASRNCGNGGEPAVPSSCWR